MLVTWGVGNDNKGLRYNFSADDGRTWNDERTVTLLSDTPVAARRRVRTLDGEPSNTATTYYSMDIAQELPQILNPGDITQGVLALMADHGYVTEHYVDALRWRPPTPEEADALGIGQGVAVLIQSRTGYQDGRPIHVTRTVWPGNTIELRYELPA